MFDTISQGQSRVESSRSRLGFALNFVDRNANLYTEAYSKIRSVDVAEESTRLIVAQVKIDRTAALIAQAEKLETSRVLSLISRGPSFKN
jgi:flagellin-like hook-associated protein FlgL